MHSKLKSEFIPFKPVANEHVMTIVSSFWLRNFSDLVQTQKDFIVDVGPNTKVLAHLNEPCHSELTSGGSRTAPTDDVTRMDNINRTDSDSRMDNVNLKDKVNRTDNLSRTGRTGQSKTIVLVVHGLEGCSSSHYVLGVAKKALAKGVSSMRMNLRNCGGTMHLAETLYNAGMSGDVIKVARSAAHDLGYEKIFLVGYSLGGNIVLKAASELASENPEWLAGVCAVSPSVDLSLSVDQLGKGLNRIYEITFMKSLRAKIVEKSKIYPDKFKVELLKNVKTVRQFDDVYTAPDGGYDSAQHYYDTCSSLSMISAIKVPALIVTAKDDPLVPFSTFEKTTFQDNIHLLAPDHGGHGAFISGLSGGNGNKINDRFWAEDRAVEFCLANL